MSDMDFLPHKNSYLLGHSEAESLFLRAWKNNTVHHAWIIFGAEGIGKATLAYRIARFLLWADPAKREQYQSLNIPVDSVVFQQIASGSHPDLKVLQRDFIETDRKKIISAIRKGEAIDEDDLANMKKSAYIRIDDVRQINNFLSKTSFNEGWRVVLIDSVDDLNSNSANALLKILEEPPAKTVLLLVSHNLGKLLPTIRSRCAKLSLKTLSQTDVASLIRRYRPQLDEQQVLLLSQLSRGSIGRALKYADAKADDIYRKLMNITSTAKFSLEQIIQFSTETASDEEKFDVLQELIVKLFKDKIADSREPEELCQYINTINAMFADCRYINMDKRLMLINLFAELRRFF